MRKPSKYQSRNSSSRSRRFSASVTDTRACFSAPGVCGASQSQSAVRKPCKTLCTVVVSYRRITIICFTSTPNRCQHLTHEDLLGRYSARCMATSKLWLLPQNVFGMTALVTVTA